MTATPETAAFDLPVLPLRDVVVFPHMVIPLFVGREKSIRALDMAMEADKRILLVAQKSAETDDPSADDLYQVGTVAQVLQLLKLPDGTIKVLVEGVARARVDAIVERGGTLAAKGHEVEPEDGREEREIEAIARSLMSLFEQYVKTSRKLPPELLQTLAGIDEPGRLGDTIAAHLGVRLADKQKLLETFETGTRLEMLVGLVDGEIDVQQMEKRIRGRVKSQMEKSQREYYLNEQMKAIQKELGDMDDAPNDMEEIVRKIAEAGMPKAVETKARSEFHKLKQMSPMSAEAAVVRNYLDWILGVPWKKRSKVRKDLKVAQDVLDADHYGLEKVKERILEYLAVQARVKQLRGPILCLVGPPGVGKTSLGQSIAKATNRKFVRMSLGGVRDESEIRGHRRTYIGSMPGKIIQSMKKAKTTNAFVLLDEIDKLGADWRGDPSSALLEVLDPAQNSTFGDHYLEVDYDLSQVMFVTTANSLNMPQPLMDRMEIIRVSGYTEDEKVEIAKRHVLPKQLEDHGLKAGELVVPDETIRELIRYYTREAGVRSLERALGGLARKAVREMARTKAVSITVDSEKLAEYAGVKKYRYGETDENDQVGIVTGLAWTEFGGDILTIEAIKMPGRGRMTVTGNLKDVMKESISAAASYVRARSLAFGVKPPVFEKTDIHVHVPDGATPKDGPSAGVAMTVAMVSVLTGIPIRKDIAMTGEITLRGRVTAIGGLKEKLLAALRSGVKTVLIPEENEKDLADVPDNVKSALEIVPISTADEALKWALTGTLTPVEWDEEAEPLPPPAPATTDPATVSVSH